MVETTSLYNESDIYSKCSEEERIIDMQNYTKKLFATFSPKNLVDEVVDEIKERLSGKCDKVFVIDILDSDECLLTYDVDNCTKEDLPENTIVINRKKTTLYTINGLNELIKKLNGGVVDESYRIDWRHYEYSFLTNDKHEFKQYKTKVIKRVDF